MKTSEIRKSFIEFFKQKEHAVVSSDSLVPENDPTLLFTGAGMNQFKDYFLGLKKDMKRATSSQKCIRTGDLDNVGVTAYHHSFFEMLGNFSFGDYFKEEAILWAWEYLTENLKIDPERLRISVHKSDDEAYRIWKEKVGIREDWIYKMGDDSNFWPANAPKDGPNGPCGPCSEIYYDIGPENAAPGDDPDDIESKRFAEIWNLVFTQYDRQSDGTLKPLANKNIDTGMGLERLACVIQGKKSNFEIDLFEPIHRAIEKELSLKRHSKNISALNAIADHCRAVVFSINDGVIPSNEGRGYVVRKLIRRALWQAYQSVEDAHTLKPFLYKVVPSVVLAMKDAYPELETASESIRMTLEAEEERFLGTLEIGLARLTSKLEDARRQKSHELPGRTVFELYDTYGFPDELTAIIAEKHGFSIDQKGFDELMEKQRTTAKAASRISESIFTTSELQEKVSALPATQFLGYEKEVSDAKVLFIESKEDEGVLALDQTPLYAESGGQIGDQGKIISKAAEATILDVQKLDKVFLHHFKMNKGSFNEGDSVTVQIERDRRFQIMRNHTATHLLHAALRKILGEQVRQLGSLVADDRLRFDYSYGKALETNQIEAIENDVNREILKNTVLVKEEKDIEQARQEGAVAFFGEKYGAKVRVVDIPGYSKELCGGTHCHATGQIGAFVIISDSSVASGTRRIEALTGERALQYLQDLRKDRLALAAELKVAPNQIGARVKKLKEQLKAAEKNNQKQAARKIDSKELLKQAETVGDIRLIMLKENNIGVPALRQISDQLKTSGNRAVYLLAAEEGEKIQFLLGRSRDINEKQVDLKEMMKELSPFLGATGGGRPDLLQGGGRNEGQLKQNWNKVEGAMKSFLEGAK